ncbi:MAG: hypothetical protein WD690_11630 [Vicinamibacterales bacterium]
MKQAAAVLLGVLAAACSGGGKSPTAPPGGGTTTQNPCASVSVETAAGARLQAEAHDKTTAVDGDARWGVLDALALHAQSGRSPRPSLQPLGPPAQDVGDIAVIQDRGDIIAPPNLFDLRSTGLRFSPSGNGYEVRKIDGAFRGTLGASLTLSDDDSAQVNVPFAFPFYGEPQQIAFVNSDGNITFEDEDKASTERNVARLMTGPPRVAPFLADLDPSAGGRVFVHAAGDQYTVTWCGVRGFESTRVTNVQATLLPEGAVELKFGETINIPDAVVGISPGRTGLFAPLDLSNATSRTGEPAAMGERFAQRPQLDTVALTRRFYETHPDDYDQLVIWTDQSLTVGAFAFEVTIANEISGIGLDLFELSGDFGSAGRLRSLAVMDFLGKYPEDPTVKFLGENTTLSILGQEVGHRWLAFMDVRDHRGQRSDALLGRGLSHWSFFFDSDASVMEGNDIQDLGGGSFRTIDAVRRYSLLDQYAMGLIEAHEVPPLFYVENPSNVLPFKDRGSSPQVGVTFNGTRRDVLIDDIVAVHGPRLPRASESPRVHRQAFLYVVGAGREAAPAQIERVDTIRIMWESFFLEGTDGRMRAETRLR